MNLLDNTKFIIKIKEKILCFLLNLYRNKLFCSFQDLIYQIKLSVKKALNLRIIQLTPNDPLLKF